MVIEVVEQVVAVAGALTGAVLLVAMVVSGWVGGSGRRWLGARPEPARVPVRR